MLRRLIVVASVASLAACAGLAEPDQMVSTGGTPLPASSPLRASITVGRVSSPLPATAVASADLAEALRDTLSARGMSAKEKPRFIVSADLLDLEQPRSDALKMEVIATVRYALTSAKSRPVYETTVTARFTADWGRSLKPGERLELATEGAMRENIRQFAEQLIAASQTNTAFNQR